ncbi:MAG TPA: lipoyl synthase [Acidimicrobiia bacterium]|nr:lipoyl synthase [Acidimicrobiia bacterium]
MSAPLRVRWLGRVPYAEAETLQRALHGGSTDDYLLLQEHPHVYTLGSRADLRHVLVPPESVGAELIRADRGGDVTYHGPGQLVGYPILSLDEWRAGQRDVVAYVRRLESVLVAVLADFGIESVPCLDGLTGVWVGGEKVAAIGVRVAGGRTRHGFALNVDPDLTMFSHIVPCGIADRGVTSMAQVLGRAPDMRAVVDRVVARFAAAFEPDELERQDVVWRETAADLSAFSASVGLARFALPDASVSSSEEPRSASAVAAGTRASDSTGAVPVRLLGRLAEAGVGPPTAGARPEWMRVKARFGDGFLDVKKLVRDLDLHTVCESAGCPNIFECWADRTATFMILGDRCTRACGFCLVDTRKPLAVDPGEPERVAHAVKTMGLEHAVITCVARDDLPDGGAAVFAATIRAIRRVSPGTGVEVLISDCHGAADALATIFDARPDVLAHNLETVARLQRAARPSAGYARSLAVLARASDAGLVTKSSVILGMGETEAEVRGALADLRGVGVDIVTLGQYLQPTARHLPIARWWTPEEFDRLRGAGEALGFAHVESGPLVRSSYHAKRSLHEASPNLPETIAVPGR